MFPAAMGLLGLTKEISSEAEVMVWSEIDKAKMFIRTLGDWYASHPEGITESELEKLALGHGLSWKGEGEEVEGKGSDMEREIYEAIAFEA